MNLFQNKTTNKRNTVVYFLLVSVVIFFCIFSVLSLHNKTVITVTADVDDNSIKEKYILSDGVLTVSESLKMVWQSPKEWQIDSFEIADSNNDGVKDINVSLWKSGSFGKSKPFWVEKNDMSIKNHFFVLDFVDGAIKQVWGSSNLSSPNCEFKIADIDDDGKNELVVIEGEYTNGKECEGKYVAVWKWNEWGFSNEWRSDERVYKNLVIKKRDGKEYFTFDTI